ncbi:(S)-canadine synthase-like [Tasmannia lanceolata]|uniref:(S)-canadine synthase-like n=1 Tax=Tasmannia lanceolata TaxID=3420 RepID=UPI004062F697
MEKWIGVLTTTVAISLLLTRLLFRSPARNAMKWPGGPKKLPIIGNMHQLSNGGDLIHVTLAKLAKIHGDVMTIWLGSWWPMIIVSDIELAWEVLVNKSGDYAARSIPFTIRLLTANGNTISSSDAGSHWQALRRGLQNGPLGPLNISSQIQLQESDIRLMIQNMKEEANQNSGIVKPFHHIRLTTVRLLSRLCFGSDFKDESFLVGMDKAVEDVIGLSSHGHIVDAFPIARHIPFLNRTSKRLTEVKQNIEKLIRPHLSSPPPNSYLHFLLSKNFPEQVTIFSLFELFLLGVDSTASTTLWALAFLIHNPQIQDKLYKEITNIKNESCNQERVVRIEDMSKLHYLQAVVKETMRMKPIAPLGVPHKVAKETKLMGETVGVGTDVMVNIYAVHHDPKLWEEPYRFWPERFWGNGRESKGGLEQGFLPFGGGMRVCAGMELAKLQVPFVLANLVNAFSWLSAVEGQLPDMTEVLNFVVVMKTSLVARILPRNN